MEIRRSRTKNVAYYVRGEICEKILKRRGDVALGNKDELKC